MERLFSFVLLMACCDVAIGQTPTWTDRTGRFTVRAELLEYDGRQLKLKRADTGVVLTLQAAVLSKKSLAAADAWRQKHERKRLDQKEKNQDQNSSVSQELYWKGIGYGVSQGEDMIGGSVQELQFKPVDGDEKDKDQQKSLSQASDVLDQFEVCRGGRRADIEIADGMRTHITDARFVGETLPLGGQLTVRSKNYHVGIPMLLVRSITLRDGVHQVIYSHEDRETMVVGELYDGQFEFKDPDLGIVRIPSKKLKSLVFMDIFEQYEEGVRRVKLSRNGKPRHRFTFADDSTLVVHWWRPFGLPSPLPRVKFISFSDLGKGFGAPLVKLETDTYTIDLPTDGGLDFGPNRSVTATLPSGRRIAARWLPDSVPFDGFRAMSESVGRVFVPLGSVKRIEATAKAD
ncbi:MAG: SHD1 domain-containing protein [Planctomycetota bacterium]|nr:SHD1 domain-containing protein [Planctomycetota bacterium]